jgi:hypothetical protein
MLLLTAPHIAGLLQAHSSVPPISFCYSSSNLSALPNHLQAHLFNATETLLNIAVTCLQGNCHSYQLQRAALQFAGEVTSLVAPIKDTAFQYIASDTEAHIRTREEMDAELQAIISQMHERIATIRGEVRHV